MKGFAKRVEDDYAELFKAAVAIWDVDDYCSHVPALYSRERAAPTRASKAKAPPGGGSDQGPSTG
jgi:hypothetical protein